MSNGLDRRIARLEAAQVQEDSMIELPPRPDISEVLAAYYEGRLPPEELAAMREKYDAPRLVPAGAGHFSPEAHAMLDAVMMSVLPSMLEWKRAEQAAASNGVEADQ